MGRKIFKKTINGFLCLAMIMANVVPFGSFVPFARAAAPGSVVINEIAWAGSADNANDEWIELYNTTGAALDLTGWLINDDNGSATYALSGSIPAHGYYLIEDSEAVVNPNVADVIVNLSLANTGDSLVLIDSGSQVIDTVNSTGGMWFAGNGTTKATMERIDALSSGDVSVNWGTSSGTGATASLGSAIIGTPEALNSVSTAQAVNAFISMNSSNASPQVGDTITVTTSISGVSNLFSYGFDIAYDPSVLTFVSATKGIFLSESGAVQTSFQSGMENNVAGKLVVAEARTIDPKVGVSGSGNLFSMTFNVIGGEGQQTNLSFGTNKFIAGTAADITGDYNNLSVNIQAASAEAVTNLTAAEGSERYSISLTWTASQNATGYKVLRMDQHGNYELIGTVTETTFTDSDAVTEAGKIIPKLNYSYRVIAVKNSIESVSVDVTGVDNRGLRGDNDRSDRVDGRDLDRLGKHFAEDDTDSGFEILVDTTYDGLIDGSDLIDIGANFALTY